MKKVIKAAFVNFDNEIYDLKQLKKSTCILSISVGQPAHEGDKLAATIKLVEQTFGSCIIMVCDSLQRHTLYIFKNCDDKPDIHTYANQLGDDWLKRNAQAIAQLHIPYKISRWDEWLSHKLYRNQKQVVDELFIYDQEFKSSVQNFTNEFISRCHKRKQIGFDFERLYSASLEYAKEECAVMPLWIEEKAAFELYPGNRPKPLNIAYKHFVQDKNLLVWLKIRFRN